MCTKLKSCMYAAVRVDMEVDVFISKGDIRQQYSVKGTGTMTVI